MSGNVVPKGTYLLVYLSLLGLTLFTTGAAFLDLGSLNPLVALTIAVSKAVLVLLFFMHVRTSDRLVWVFAAAGFFWLAILMSLTLSDVLTRGWQRFLL